ncbi:alpha/beta hydrolase [Plastoroseomonas arctica]|uniref:Alpha/beta hydrolase n=1 Tax=Plastoroseomonas arctica TaxID=1509237 RepID=A0AAF1KN27_9PROT|nr:alpha/beta hydrolase [Plastoroseomonas arctica]MBR0657086.1 alpha/beta hydrolase [Plastoroseomonas arctica]
MMVLVALGLGACRPLGVLDAITPVADVPRALDRAYAPGPRGGVDLYWPQSPAPGTPILVFFYGGNWRTGDRADYRFAGEAFAGRGYITAVPDYRVFPEGRFPRFVQDGAAAVAGIRALVAAQGLPADGPLILAGHSAGAHLAMLLALDPRWLAAAGLPRCGVSAVLGLAGPYDFLPIEAPDVRAVFADAADLRDTQPITFASADDPPAVLLHGTGDTVVRSANSERLAQALRSAGGTASLRLYPGAGHSEIVAALAAPLRGVAPVLADADTLLRAALASPRPRCS